VANVSEVRNRTFGGVSRRPNSPEPLAQVVSAGLRPPPQRNSVPAPPPHSPATPCPFCGVFLESPMGGQAGPAPVGCPGSPLAIPPLGAGAQPSLGVLPPSSRGVQFIGTRETCWTPRQPKSKPPQPSFAPGKKIRRLRWPVVFFSFCPALKEILIPALLESPGFQKEKKNKKRAGLFLVSWARGQRVLPKININGGRLKDIFTGHPLPRTPPGPPKSAPPGIPFGQVFFDAAHTPMSPIVPPPLLVPQPERGVARRGLPTPPPLRSPWGPPPRVLFFFPPEEKEPGTAVFLAARRAGSPAPPPCFHKPPGVGSPPPRDSCQKMRFRVEIEASPQPRAP